MSEELWAVKNDPNTHAGGALIPQNPRTVYIEGNNVIEYSDPAFPDALCPAAPHCNPASAEGSASVFVYGNPVHRNNDLRICGAKTIVQNQSTVWAGDVANVQSIAGNIFVGAPMPFVSDEQAAAVIQGAADEAAAGGSSTRNDPFEYGDGGIGGISPVTGESGALPSGQAAAGGEPQEGPGAGPPAEGGEWLVFLPHTDSRVNSQLAEKAIAVAQAMNIQLTVTSAYRSPEYNQRVGGVKSSAHIRGNALDIVQSSFTQAQRSQFIQEAVRQGIGGIGLYNTFTHIDVEGARAWGPNGSRTSLPQFPWAVTALQQVGRG